MNERLSKIKNKGRFYTHGKLVVWSTPQCIICGRFLSRWQKAYCSLHSKITKKLSKEIHKEELRKYMREYQREKRGTDRSRYKL